MTWITLLSDDGGIAVADYETVYYGPDEQKARDKADTESKERPGKRVLVVRVVDTVYTSARVITEHLGS